MSLHDEGPEVESRLAQMGLTLEGLLRVVRAAGAAYASTTAFHPSSGPGTYMYQECVAVLRRWLVPRGWDHDEAGGQPRTFSAEYGVSIIIQSGDENTGVDTGTEPRSRNAHGAATGQKIQDNNAQLTLPFAVSRPQVSEEQEGPAFFTWVLLLNVTDESIRAELSLPTDFQAGKPAAWAERILLPEQPFGEGEPNVDEGDDEGPENEVSVEWK